MKQYRDALSGYGDVAGVLHTNMIGLALNFVVDKVGHIGGEDETTKSFFKLRDNVLYRLSSLSWHLHTICSTHLHHEAAFSSNPGEFDLTKAHLTQAFAVDDILFNVLSLYDYWANFVGFAVLGPNKKKIGWRSLTSTASDASNAFSQLEVAASIVSHRKEWAGKLEDLRAEVIHYNSQEGKTSQKIAVEQGKEAQFTVDCAMPEKMAKKLQLGVGIDAQNGSIELCRRSVAWLGQATKIVCEKNTSNSVRRA